MTATTSAGTPRNPQPLTDADLLVLKEASIVKEDAERQVAMLRGGMKRPKLLRPCTLGDGIGMPDPEGFEESARMYREACREGRWIHFIPASGAATRMADSLRDREALEKTLREQGHDPAELFDLLGDPDALADLPKALMPFHKYGSVVRTPVEEHVREAAALAGGAEARLHFTISPEHEKGFLREVERVLALLRGEGIRAEVTHSFQEPSTQTLALDEEGNPFRDAEGRLVLRPGGHGSLLRNLEACGGEFVWVRNIDNIPVEAVRAEGRPLRLALGGMLMRTAKLSDDRPVRVAGMVRNTGEPGGGPFWIRTAEGSSIRIVESAEVDKEDGAQNKIFAAATHFNPVDLACALRDPTGKAFRLEEFAEPSACFIAEKTHGGRPLRALEWPGLWNGAMAYWGTHCVEIPLAQFAPVKTAADLMRAEHRGS